MESVVRLRLLLILFDLVNILLLWKLFKNNGMGSKGVVLYAFSPLVILELVGNLHFEGIVLTCLLVTVISIQKMQIGKAAFSWACAIGLKLVPLILAPLWAFNLKKRTLIRFVSVAVLALAVFFRLF
jgi:alpha-1,6-mannosyltransferase